MSDINNTLNHYAQLNKSLIEYVELLESRLTAQITNVKTIFTKVNTSINNEKMEELKLAYKNLKEHVRLATENDNLTRLSKDLRYFEEFDKKELENEIYNLKLENKMMNNEFNIQKEKIERMEHKHKELKLQINYLCQCMDEGGNENFIKLIKKLMADLENSQVEKEIIEIVPEVKELTPMDMLAFEKAKSLEFINIELKNRLDQKTLELKCKEVETNNLIDLNIKLEQKINLVNEMQIYITKLEMAVNEYKGKYEKVYEELVKINGPVIYEIEKIRQKNIEHQTSLETIKSLFHNLERKIPNESNNEMDELNEKIKIKDEQIVKLKKVVEELKKIRIEYLQMKKEQNTEDLKVKDSTL